MYSCGHCENGRTQNHGYQKLSLAIALPGLVFNARGGVIVNSPWTRCASLQLAENVGNSQGLVGFMRKEKVLNTNVY